MITLLLGSDTLAKKLHIKQAAEKAGAEVETFTDSSALPALGTMFEQQLFGAPKIVVLDGVWTKIDADELLEKVGDNKSAQLFIVENSLDKRVKANQAFIKDKRVTVLEMDAPVGTRAASDWITSFAKQQGIKIEPAAIIALVKILLPDEEASLNVVRAQSELMKLKAYANGEAVNTTMVALLIETESSVDVFALLNAIATKNKKLAVQLLETFFATETTDEKLTTIKFVGLLADQFRSLVVVLDADQRHMSDTAILKMTGWKSGRLYILKKLSRNFTIPKLKIALGKLENLDRELKTGTMPPHVVLDLIVADM